MKAIILKDVLIDAEERTWCQNRVMNCRMRFRLAPVTTGTGSCLHYVLGDHGPIFVTVADTVFAVPDTPVFLRSPRKLLDPVKVLSLITCILPSSSTMKTKERPYLQYLVVLSWQFFLAQAAIVS